MKETYHLKFKWLVITILQNPNFLILLTILIPTLGLFLEVFIPGKIMFARSGAVLVCLAILGVYLNHFVVKEEVTQKGLFDFLNDNNGSAPRLPEEMGEEAQKAFDEKHKLVRQNQLKYSNEQRLKLNSVSDRIVLIEFIAGISGTLIWGFGELPF